MKAEDIDVPKSSMITTFAFTFDRPSNGMLGIYRDPVLYTVLVAGPRPVERELKETQRHGRKTVG